MKILLLGDASNCHFSLSRGLAELGHDVTVASNGSGWMGTSRNIDLSRQKGKMGGLWLWLKLNTLLSGDLKGYDVVQIGGPIFVDLRPEKVRTIFDRLKRNNGKVFMTAFGSDSQYVRFCQTDALRYNEWRCGGEPTPYAMEHPERLRAWLNPMLSDHCQYVYDRIDGAIAVLYEYYLALQDALPKEKIAYGGIPIDTAGIVSNSNVDDRVRIMLACHKGREKEKGADIMLDCINRVVSRHSDKVDFRFVQNLPLTEFKQVMDRTQIVVDQLYSYTPATTALMAMARGKVVVSGAEPEYLDFIGEKSLNPILNVDPLNLHAFEQDLERLILNPDYRNSLSQQGPEFVEKHNNLKVVANRFIDFWERRML